MKILLLIVALFATTTLYAGQVSTHGLTAEQKAHIDVQIANMKLQKEAEASKSTVEKILESNSDMLTADNLDKLDNIGTKVGHIITSFLKEIGLGIDAFLRSPYGFLAVVWAVLHLYGATVINLVCFWYLNIVMWRIFNVIFENAFFDYKKIHEGGDESNAKPVYTVNLFGENGAPDGFVKVFDKDAFENSSCGLAIALFISIIIIDLVWIFNSLI